MSEEKKKAHETTFKASPISEEEKRHILAVLKEDGFSEEQLNEMSLKRVWKLYLDSMEKLFSDEIAKMASAIERNPQFAPMFNMLFKRLNRQLEDLVDSLEKKLDKNEKKGVE